MMAAIFDMDGLLIDSEPFWRQAERRVFAAVGVHLSDDMCRRTQGMRTDEVVAYWYRQHPWRGKSREAVRREIIAAVADLIENGGAALPGVYTALKALREAGVRLGLASSSPHELIRAVVARLRLEDCFEATCSAMDHERGKPDPAVYLEAARRLSAAPAECVAFEDSIAGVQSAKAAGMTVVAVPAPEHFGHEAFAAADWQLPSLEALSVTALQRLFRAPGA